MENSKNDLKTAVSEMSKHIASIEIVIKDIVYKVYFPVLDRANQTKDITDNYINISGQNLENLIFYILNNYDNINIDIETQYKFLSNQRKKDARHTHN